MSHSVGCRNLWHVLRLPLFVAVASLLLVVSGCGSSDSSDATSTAGADQTLKVVVSLPVTGSSARVGTEMKNAVDMAMSKADYTVGSYKIELFYSDEKGGDPAAATQNYMAVISNDKVQAGLLGWHGSVGIALMDVAARYKLPHLFSLSAPGIINEKFNKDREKYGYWAAKGWADPLKMQPAYVDMLNAAVADGSFKPASKTVALFGEDTDYGRSVVGAMAPAFKEGGWTIKATEFFPIDSTNHIAMLNKFKSMGVAVVAGTAGSPDAISALVKQRKEVGLDALLIADGVGYVSDFYKLTGSASDGVIDMQPVLTTPEQMAFSDEFKAKYGYAPGAAAGGLAYDYTNFYLKVLQATLDRDGKLDSESIYKTVQDELWTGNLTYEDGVVMPSYRYTADTIPDPVVGTDAFYFPIIQYNKGKAVVIYPSEVAKGKLEVAQ